MILFAVKIGYYQVNAPPWARHRPTASTCLWAQGLCGGPDAPVANGGPPLSAQRLTFRTRLSAGSTACWDTVLIGRTLYIALPPHILPEGSRDAFVALLEAAEEKLNCQHVVVSIAKSLVANPVTKHPPVQQRQEDLFFYY